MDTFTKTTLADDIHYCMGILIGNFHNSKVYAKQLEQLLVTLGSVMDKPLNPDNPKYCCRDLIEKVKKYLEHNIGEIEYSRDIIIAKTLAFGKYPQPKITDNYGNEADMNYYARRGFVSGYMEGKKRK